MAGDAEGDADHEEGQYVLCGDVGDGEIRGGAVWNWGFCEKGEGECFALSRSGVGIGGGGNW